MPTIALIDPDGLLAADLDAHLVALGWSVQSFGRQRSMLNQGVADPPAVVILAADGDAERARGMTRELRRAGLDAAVVWYLHGSGPTVVQRAEQPDAVLFGPTDRDGVESMLHRATRQSRIHDAWSGVDFFRSVDGSLRRYPPFRLLFLAHRVRVSGRIAVYADGRETVVDLKDGTVVGVRGLPELLAPLGVKGGANDTLTDLITAAMRANLAPDRALETAGTELGRWMAGLLDGPAGTVSCRSNAESDALVPLSMSVSQMLARGLREVRPVESVIEGWRVHWNDRVEPRPPDDAPDIRWGLDPVALRLLKRAAAEVTLDELVGASRRPDAVLAADLLIQLGIVSLVGAPPAQAHGETSGPDRPSPPQSRRVVTDVRPPEAERDDPDDERVAELQTAYRELCDAGPVAALGITKSQDLTVEGISKALRQRSYLYHPDRFVGAGPTLRDLAERCFSRLVEAHETLSDEETRNEAAARMRAKEEGRQHIGDADRKFAQLEYAKGEVAYKRRLWTEARLAFEASLSRVPGEWRAQYFGLLSAFRDGSLPPMTVLGELERLEIPDSQARADRLFECGEIALAEGLEDRAYRFFQRAVREDPRHVGARRRLRLRRMRKDAPVDVSDPTTGSGGESFFGSLFRRRGK